VSQNRAQAQNPKSPPLIENRRSAPPATSRPEAENFPSGHYTFEGKRKKFHAPPTYPEPPKGLWYPTPETKAPSEELPKPIFPWESGPKRPTATRVFSSDYPPTPVQESVASPTQPTNWQDMSGGGMEQYIRNIMQSHRHGPASPSSSSKDPASTSRAGRPESLLFSGIPAVEDRPSLPVTPAPMRTSRFRAEGEDGITTVAPEALTEQAEWVCPSCGFSSSDPAAFIPIPARTGIASSSTSPPPPPPPPHPSSTESRPTVAVPESSATMGREAPHGRTGTGTGTGSSMALAVSDTRTTVPYRATSSALMIPEPVCEVQTAPGAEPEAKDGGHGTVSATPLLPPAWLTAAVKDDD
jgi:glycogenin glucosyltransferase